jgi:hypothetical protein
MATTDLKSAAFESTVTGDGIVFVDLRDGVQLFSQAGALPGHALDDFIDQVKALDMDEVRDEISSQQSVAEDAVAP